MAKQKPVLNEAGTHVWLHNAATGGNWLCPVDVVDVFLPRGWEYTDAPDTSLEGLFDDSTAEGANQTGFDPATSDVAGVNDHLVDALEAGALGEIERVLTLEKAGKNRVTVVDPRPPVADPDADPDADPENDHSDQDPDGPGTGD